MCSVSWQWNQAGGEKGDLVIFFNRDEQKLRAAGEPPRIINHGKRKILCPVDPKKGGTWFAANDAGLVVCILNQYRDTGAMPKNAKSRGKLVREVTQASTTTEIHGILHAAAQSYRYPPFTVLAWHHDKVRMWTWANGNFGFNPRPVPLITSSSWETDRVEQWRKDFYQQKVVGEGWSLDQFHRHSIAGDEASSVCMMRERTQTVSLTRCCILAGQVQMGYFPRDNEGHFGEEQSASMPVNLLL